MKKILAFLLSLSFLASLTGCSLMFDDYKIEGKWSANTGSSTTYLEFKGDKTYVQTESGSTSSYSGTWSMDTSAKTLTIKNSGGTFVNSYSFTDSDTLLITSSGSSIGMTLKRVK